MFPVTEPCERAARTAQFCGNAVGIRPILKPMRVYAHTFIAPAAPDTHSARPTPSRPASEAAPSVFERHQAPPLLATLYGRVQKPRLEPAAEVRRLALQANLGENGREYLEDVLTLIKGTPEEQEHLRKLRVMMQTPYAPAQTAHAQTNELRSAVLRVQTERAQALEAYRAAGGRPDALPSRLDPSYEERKAASPARQWVQHTPSRYVHEGEYVRVDRTNPDDLVVQIRVHLRGEADKVEMVRYLEDAIEKHLGVPGFTVDLVFADEPGPGVYTVQVDPEGWTTSRNWIGDHTALAHELMHLLGVDDEYDYTSHHDNAAMEIQTRLYWYREAVRRGPVPADAEDGIMVYSSRRPLRRHIEYAVGLTPNQNVTVGDTEPVV